MSSLLDLRTRYSQAGLLEQSALASPTEQLQQWLDQAMSAGVPDPNAMTLATVSAVGQPRARVVLLRQLDAAGLTFFTNYDSDKGHELAREARACLSFVWLELGRQVRVEGATSKVSAAESDAYFATRPRGHQIGAWASAQSRPIASRAALEARVTEIEARFAGQPVPRPELWGGFRLAPALFEFWQGQDNRLHDRLRYVPAGGAWRIERLCP